MSAFEDFVQIELPKRPYLDTDVAQESVIVRRGAGPRQLGGVQLSNGQVLAMVSGTLQGVDLTSGPISAIKKHSESFVSLTTWAVEHNKNSSSYVVQVFDDTGKVIIPDEIETIDANNIDVTFNTATTGTVNIIFLD